jgi:hypothetical protein
MTNAVRRPALRGDQWRAFWIASIVACLTSAADAQNQGLPDSSGKTLCWDTLQNVARDRYQNTGKLDATGNYAGQHIGSSEDRKVQGPGAEPKDSTGVTVGEGNAGRPMTGASVRPPGLPNC